MSSTYTGNAANITTPVIQVTIPADGDADTAASVNGAFQKEADYSAYIQSAFAQMLIPGGRLSLTSGTPVTSADVTGATTVYYTPHKHTLVPIFNGTSWAFYTFSELSQLTTDATKSPAAVAANSCYDVFVWSDGGTLRATRGPAWTNDNTRALALALQNGRYVNGTAITNGPPALQGTYVGTIRSDGSSAINDAQAKRHVWNMHNRVTRNMFAGGQNSTWSYAGTTWRQANANSANQLDFVLGLLEDTVSAKVVCVVQPGTANTKQAIGIGVDGTPGAGLSTLVAGSVGVELTTEAQTLYAEGSTITFANGVGRHTLIWSEITDGNSATFYGYQFIAAFAYSSPGIYGLMMG